MSKIISAKTDKRKAFGISDICSKLGRARRRKTLNALRKRVAPIMIRREKMPVADSHRH